MNDVCLGRACHRAATASEWLAMAVAYSDVDHAAKMHAAIGLAQMALDEAGELLTAAVDDNDDIDVRAAR